MRRDAASRWKRRALQVAEKLKFTAVSYQGTTSVVPYDVENTALAPEGTPQRQDDFFSILFSRCGNRLIAEVGSSPLT
jgi:hypothetical protein